MSKPIVWMTNPQARQEGTKSSLALFAPDQVQGRTHLSPRFSSVRGNASSEPA